MRLHDNLDHFGKVRNQQLETAQIKIAYIYRKLLKMRKKRVVVKKEEEPKKVVKGRVKPYIDARGKTYDEVNKGGKQGKKGIKGERAREKNYSANTHRA